MEKNLTDKFSCRPFNIFFLLTNVIEKKGLISLLSAWIIFWTTCFEDFTKPITWIAKELDNSGFTETLIIDLSKAYDCSPNDEAEF